MFFYFDYTYVIIVLPALIFSLWASARVKTTFAKYNRIASVRGITGAQAAEALLKANNINDVKLQPISSSLGDNYNPQTKIASLSVYNDTSISGIGVACHEIGHAIQHAEGYAPVKLRTAIVPITNFGAKLSMPLILLGLILSTVSYFYYNLVYAGIICFGLCVFFQLITLPVEFDASRRAIQGIETMNFLTDAELDGAKKVLKAAALTYIASLAVSLAQLFRFLILFAGGRRD